MPTANVNQVGSVQSSVGTPVESIISGHSASMASPMSGSVASPLAPSVTPSYANIVAASISMTPPPMSSDSTTKSQGEGKLDEKCKHYLFNCSIVNSTSFSTPWSGHQLQRLE